MLFWQKIRESNVFTKEVIWINFLRWEWISRFSTLWFANQLFIYNFSITFNDSILAEKTSKLSESLNLSVSQAGLENLTMSESKKDQLKAAFLLFCKREFVSFKHSALCSRNFQNVKLRLDFVDIYQFYRHSDFAWNQVFSNLFS